jgi:DNA polymerase I-like protein with 3'-5' exonuclease and polymerase domains
VVKAFDVSRKTFQDAIVVDFESMPIKPRPDYPPTPVGVAIWWPGRKPVYYAWGHIGHENPHTLKQGRKAILKAFRSKLPLLFHNAKFDVCVAVRKLRCPMPAWHRIHDTMWILFLQDPRLPTFELKPNAERLLKEPPEERDAVHTWLITHQPVPGVKISKSKKSEHYAGAYIAYAPPDLVSQYAIGDVTRTRGIALKVWPEIQRRKMVEAYNRERRLLPCIMEMEEQGARVNLEKLRRDVGFYDDVLDCIDAWIWDRLGRVFNIDAGEALVSAMVAAKVADVGLLGMTKGGKRGKPQIQTNKEAIERGVSDEQFRAVLTYRGKLATSLRTFMHPWLRVAERTGGLIFCTWHTTRTDKNGARTGRASSTPNFQNLAKEFPDIFRHDIERTLAKMGEAHKDYAATFAKIEAFPASPIEDLPILPNLRTYLIPYNPGEVFIDRDYSQQELRILAYYEGGVLLDSYLANWWLDVHGFIRGLVNDLLQSTFSRKDIKTTVFGIIYGMGVGKLARKMGCTVEKAKQIKAAIYTAVAGIRALNDDMKGRAKRGEPIRTWGGREYYCEAAKFIDGKMRDFAYRMLNILIQGGAADVTKEAMIRYHNAKARGHRLILAAHDELLASVPAAHLKRGMEIMRKAMEGVTFSPPMLSEGKYSFESWGALKSYDKEGKIVCLEEFRKTKAGTTVAFKLRKAA